MLEAIINRIKSKIGFIIIIFFILLTALRGKYMYGGYVPTGEFYAKTDPTSSGDAGEKDVIDIELLKRSYNINEDIIATIGIGTKDSTAHFDEFYLKVAYNYNIEDAIVIKYDEPFDTNNFPVYEEKSYLGFLGHHWYWYPDFYPEHHIDVSLNIPTDVEAGTIMILIDDSLTNDDYFPFRFFISYEIIDDQIIFND